MYLQLNIRSLAITRAIVAAVFEASIFATALLTNATAQSIVEEIHVTGVLLNTNPNELAQSVSVVRDETLERIRAGNIGETLSGQLGISSSFFGAGASRPIIRGLAGARVRMMEDGMDSMDVSTVSGDHAVTLDPIVAEQIEIFRGPTTLLYGSGAVGGVINTKTRRIPGIFDDGSFDESLDAVIELRGDTAANNRSAAFAIDGETNRLAWHLDAMSRDDDDYEIPQLSNLDDSNSSFGFVPNSDLSIDSAAFGLSHLGDNGYFGVSYSRFDSNYGLPFDADEEIVRIDLAQSRLGVKGSWLDLHPMLQAVNFSIAVNDYEHVELEDGLAGTVFRNDALDGRLEILHRPWGEWSGAFGLHSSSRQFAAVGSEAYIPPVDTKMNGVFFIEQRDTEYWKLSFGARLERQVHTPSNGLPESSGTASSISLAGVRDFANSIALALNFSHAERLPVAEELYADGPHLASGIIEIGNAAIDRESSRHFDISLRGSNEELNWSVTAFLTQYDDFIYLQDLGLFDTFVNLPIFEFAQQDADLYGLEAEVFTPIATMPQGEIDIRLYADFVSGRLSNNNRIPRIPPRRFGARLQYHNDHLIVGLEATRHATQRRTAAFEAPTAGFTLVNADLKRSWHLSSDTTLDVFVRATNLLDQDARRHSSFVKEFAPLPGRNYSVGLRTTF